MWLKEEKSTAGPTYLILLDGHTPTIHSFSSHHPVLPYLHPAWEIQRISRGRAAALSGRRVSEFRGRRTHAALVAGAGRE
jgi:hypothetical protein